MNTPGTGALGPMLDVVEAKPAPVPRGHCGRCLYCGGEITKARRVERYDGRPDPAAVGICVGCWRSVYPVARDTCAGCGAPYEGEPAAGECPAAELDSPPFAPAALADLAARGFERVNRTNTTAERERDEARAVLRELEWAGEHGACLVCRACENCARQNRTKFKGHRHDCALKRCLP